MALRQNAHIGVAYLEASVLGVLENAPEEGLKPREISQRLGIPSYLTNAGKYYGIIHGILAKLNAEELVQQVEEGVRDSPWKLRPDPPRTVDP